LQKSGGAGGTKSVLPERAESSDNSLEEDASKRVIARKNRNRPIDVLDRMMWRKIVEAVGER
jgi:hypothetical protein